MLKVYFSYLFPSHRAQTSLQTPSVLRRPWKDKMQEQPSLGQRRGPWVQKRPYRDVNRHTEGAGREGRCHPWPLCLSNCTHCRESTFSPSILAQRSFWWTRVRLLEELLRHRTEVGLSQKAGCEWECVSPRLCLKAEDLQSYHTYRLLVPYYCMHGNLPREPRSQLHSSTVSIQP